MDKKKKVKDYSFVIGIISLVIVLGLWTVNYNYGLSLDSESDITRGVFGDMFGAVNAIFSGLAFAGIILSLYMQRIELRIQRKELKLTRKEVKRTNKEFKLQNQTMELQKFENTFFNLLNIHHDIVKNIDFEPKKIIENEDVLRNYLVSNPSGLDEISDQLFGRTNETTLTSRDVFKFTVSFLFNLLETDLITNKFAGNIDMQLLFTHSAHPAFNQLRQFWDDDIITTQNKDKTKFNSIFQYTYHKLSTDFGHYFRNLYRIIKIVDKKVFDIDPIQNFKIQYEYTSIIRAQLSDDEIKLIFFNCLFRNGLKKFKPLVEKYTLLKIIDTDNPVYGFYAKFYMETAIKKHDENNIKDHLKHFAK